MKRSVIRGWVCYIICSMFRYIRPTLFDRWRVNSVVKADTNVCEKIEMNGVKI